MTRRDVRICVFGDSFVVGVGDHHGLGWTGRLARDMTPADVSLTVYGLGVRGDTSTDIAARFSSERDRRHRPGSENRVVFSFGVNDALATSGLSAERSGANLRRLLRRAASREISSLVVGPTPLADQALDARVADLSCRFKNVCDDLKVPFVEVHASLSRSGWGAQIRDSDGAHPSAAGYGELAQLVAPHWATWLRQQPSEQQEGQA